MMGLPFFLPFDMLNDLAAVTRIDGDMVCIAQTERDLVWQRDKVSLSRFQPLTEKRIGSPMLLCYGLIGRWSMMDLQPDRSLVRRLLEQGMDLYILDWGTPTRADRFLSIDDYVLGYLADAVDEVIKRTGGGPITLFGVCQGGTFATAYAALYPENLATLVLAITPVDFHADRHGGPEGVGLINAWLRSLNRDDVKRFLRAVGNFPGYLTAQLFNQLTPLRTMLKYNVDLAAIVESPERLMNWLCMEAWMADRPDLPGGVAMQWICDLYQDNLLIQNVWELDGRRVDLGKIVTPVLNICATGDHIVPPETSRALGTKISSKIYEELTLPGGHVGIFVGARAQKLFAPSVVEFLRQIGQGV